MFELAVVIPTRDEADSLEAVLEELHTVVIGSGFSTEVIVVDDASADGTLELAKRLAVELPLLHLTISRPRTREAVSARCCASALPTPMPDSSSFSRPTGLTRSSSFLKC